MAMSTQEMVDYLNNLYNKNKEDSSTNNDEYYKTLPGVSKTAVDKALQFPNQSQQSDVAVDTIGPSASTPITSAQPVGPETSSAPVSTIEQSDALASLPKETIYRILGVNVKGPVVDQPNVTSTEPTNVEMPPETIDTAAAPSDIEMPPEVIDTTAAKPETSTSQTTISASTSTAPKVSNAPLEQQLTDVSKQLEDSIMRKGEIMQNEAQQLADQKTKDAAVEAEANRLAEEQTKRRQQMVDVAMLEMQQRSQRLRDAAQNVDQLFPTNRTLTNIVGQSMLAISAGMGSNTAANLLNLNIERESENNKLSMEARSNYLAGLKTSVAAAADEISAYGNAALQGANTNVVLQAARKEAAAQQLEAMAAKMAPGKIKEDTIQAAALVRQQNIKDQLGIAASQADMALKLQIAEMRRKSGGGGGGFGSGNVGNLGVGRYASLQDIPNKLQNKAVRLPDGTWILTTDTETKKKADEALVGSNLMTAHIDSSMRALNDKIPGFVDKLKGNIGWTTEDAAVIKNELTQLMLAGKDYYELGQLTEGDMDIVRNLGADPGSINNFFGSKLWEKLQNWRNGITADSVKKLYQYGIDIDQKSYGEAPKQPNKSSSDYLSEMKSEPSAENPAANIVQSARNYLMKAKESGASYDEIVKMTKQAIDANKQRIASLQTIIAAQLLEIDTLSKVKNKSSKQNDRIQKLNSELESNRAKLAQTITANKFIEKDFETFVKNKPKSLKQAVKVLQQTYWK